MTRAGRSGTLLWALLALLAAVIVTRATYTADLSAFLPRRASPTQRLLVEQLRAGPAAHLILAAIEGGDARGRAQVSADPDLLASFAIDGKAPRTVVVMTVDEIYFQCARAIVRSDLWNPDKRVDPKTLPTPGQILAEMSENRVGGEDYDRAWPERARQTLW